MEWKYFDKEEPTEEGTYLTYTATGRILLYRWSHIWTDSEGKLYTYEFRNRKDAGFSFIGPNGRSDVKRASRIVLWCAIPKLPDNVSKKEMELSKYRAQIKELKARIKALEEG